MLKTLREKFNHFVLEILNTSVILVIALGGYVVIAFMLLLLTDMAFFARDNTIGPGVFVAYEWINISYIIGLLFNTAAMISVMRYSSDKIYQKDAIVPYILVSIFGYYYINLFLVTSVTVVAIIEVIGNSGKWVKNSMHFLIENAEKSIKKNNG